MLKILFFVLPLLILTSIVQSKQYVYHEEIGGWMALHRIPSTWHEAFLQCQYEGSTLASPLNDGFVQGLATIVKNHRTSNVNKIYLGTHSRFSNGNFFSIDGTPLDDMLIKWDPQGIGNETGKCLTFDGRTEYMRIESCDLRLPYVCYRKPGAALNACGTFDKGYKQVAINSSTSKCYKLHRYPQVWSRAYHICAAEGGYLLIPDNAEEAQAVLRMFPAEYIFLGIRDWNNDLSWFTIHGQRLEDVFDNWGQGQPDNFKGVQHCAVIHRGGNLDDIQCDSKQMFVCERDIKPDVEEYSKGPENR